MTPIRFEVLGDPKPAGSKRVVPIYNKLGPVLKDGRPLTRAVDDNPKTADWKQQVAKSARDAYQGPLLTGAVALHCTFFRPRPKGHFGSGRNAHVLRPTAPLYPTTKPDVLKLARAVEDSLKGVVWRDDSQVVSEILSKRWGEYFKVEIVINPLDS